MTISNHQVVQYAKLEIYNNFVLNNLLNSNFSFIKINTINNANYFISVHVAFLYKWSKGVEKAQVPFIKKEKCKCQTVKK